LQALDVSPSVYRRVKEAISTSKRPCPRDGQNLQHAWRVQGLTTKASGHVSVPSQSPKPLRMRVRQAGNGMGTLKNCRVFTVGSRRHFRPPSGRERHGTFTLALGTSPPHPRTGPLGESDALQKKCRVFTVGWLCRPGAPPMVVSFNPQAAARCGHSDALAQSSSPPGIKRMRPVVLRDDEALIVEFYRRHEGHFRPLRLLPPHIGGRTALTRHTRQPMLTKASCGQSCVGVSRDLPSAQKEAWRKMRFQPLAAAISASSEDALTRPFSGDCGRCRCASQCQSPCAFGFRVFTVGLMRGLAQMALQPLAAALHQ
jgi:hypothetical protein